ncbi:hypothetical protein D6855_05605 [Butyrivibrio sp. CB08]|nr:hypothetical protein D6855_05605 [Butyrivibrio sp. CB08]
MPVMADFWAKWAVFQKWGPYCYSTNCKVVIPISLSGMEKMRIKFLLNNKKHEDYQYIVKTMVPHF